MRIEENAWQRTQETEQETDSDKKFKKKCISLKKRQKTQETKEETKKK